LNIKIIHSTHIEKTKWDSLVGRSTTGSIYCTYTYLSLCEGDWEAIIGIENGDYVCALPVPFRTKGGVKYIYQSPLIPFLSILTQPEYKVSEEFFLNAIANLNSYHYIAKFFVKHSPPIQLDKCRTTEHMGLAIDLQKRYSEIFNDYSSSRKGLKQARSEQEIVKSHDLDLFVKMHKELTLPKIENIHDGQQHVMTELWRSLLQNNELEIYFSKTKSGETTSGLLIGKGARHLYYLESASTHEGRKLNGIALLIDYIVQEYAQSVYQYFDLGGKGPAGVAEFKLSFGSKEYSYTQYYRNNLPWYIKIPKAVLNYFGFNSGQKLY
jgi:Acetyltransferase (GNAT) domain